MINPLSIVTGIGMAIIIGQTFEVKRHVGALDRELRDIRRTTEEVENRSQTLAAEWARLNDQERLRGLADRHLGQMVPMQPMQFVRLDEGVRRLPAALAWAGEESPFAPRRQAPPTAQVLTAVLAPVSAPVLAPVLPRAPAGDRMATPAAIVPAGPSLPASNPPRMAMAAAAAGPAAVQARPAAPAAQPAAQPAPAAAPPSNAEVARPPALGRPIQLAEAAPARPTAAPMPAPRAVPVLPERAIAGAVTALPAVAAPPAALARVAAAPPAARPPVLTAMATGPRPADSAALPPARPAMLQRVDTGSLLGGQAVAMAPPVPWGR